MHHPLNKINQRVAAAPPHATHLHRARSTPLRPGSAQGVGEGASRLHFTRRVESCVGRGGRQPAISDTTSDTTIMSVDSEPLGEDEMFTFDEEAGTQDMMKHEDLDEAPHVRTLPPLHTPWSLTPLTTRFRSWWLRRCSSATGRVPVPCGLLSDEWCNVLHVRDFARLPALSAPRVSPFRLRGGDGICPN